MLLATAPAVDPAERKRLFPEAPLRMLPAASSAPAAAAAGAAPARVGAALDDEDAVMIPAALVVAAAPRAARASEEGSAFLDPEFPSAPRWDDDVPAHAFSSPARFTLCRTPPPGIGGFETRRSPAAGSASGSFSGFGFAAGAGGGAGAAASRKRKLPASGAENQPPGGAGASAADGEGRASKRARLEAGAEAAGAAAMDTRSDDDGDGLIAGAAGDRGPLAGVDTNHGGAGLLVAAARAAGPKMRDATLTELWSGSVKTGGAVAKRSSHDRRIPE